MEADADTTLLTIIRSDFSSSTRSTWWWMRYGTVTRRFGMGGSREEGGWTYVLECLM